MDSEFHFKSESQVGMCKGFPCSCGASYYWLHYMLNVFVFPKCTSRSKVCSITHIIQGVGYENAKLRRALYQVGVLQTEIVCNDSLYRISFKDVRVLLIDN